MSCHYKLLVKLIFQASHLFVLATASKVDALPEFKLFFLLDTTIYVA